MPAHTEQQILPFTVAQLFDLVADIERYPEFLPWCRAARVLSHGDGEMLGELVIAFAYMSESYVSRVVLQPPASAQDSASIDVTLVKGPFEYLINRWHFVPLEDGKTQVEFFVDFKFQSRIMEKMMGGLFGKATDKMVSAFRARAETLYGKP